MSQFTSALAALVSICQVAASGYNGPNGLGPFRVDRVTTLRVLFAQIGEPKAVKASHFCYRSRDSRGFLWIDRMAHEPSQAGDILLSDFPNCMDQDPNLTSRNLSAWKADKGIGLGSSEIEVLNAYGTPSKKHPVDARSYRWVIQGDRCPDDRRSERGDYVLVYEGADDLRTAEFGMRNGRVAWIFLSRNE